MSAPYRNAPLIERPAPVALESPPSPSPWLRVDDYSDGSIVVQRRAVARVLGTRVDVFALALCALAGPFVLLAGGTSLPALLACSLALTALGTACLVWGRRWTRVVDELEIGPNGLAWRAHAGARERGVMLLDEVRAVEPGTFEGQPCLVVRGAQQSLALLLPRREDDDPIAATHCGWLAERISNALERLRAG